MGPVTSDWKIQGSAAKPYEIQLHDDDTMSCNCPQWTVGWKRNLGYRSCKHIDEIARREGLRIQRDGEYVKAYVVVNGKTPSAPRLSAPVKKAPTWAEEAVERAERASRKAEAVVTERVAQKHEYTFIEPMLASKMPAGWNEDRYSSNEYVMEEKYDGHRIVVRVDDGKVTAWSRLGNARALPTHIAAVFSGFIDCVIDGELVVPGMKSYDVTAGINSGKESYIAFDIIEALGKRVGYNQRERRGMLANVFNENKSKLVTLSRQMPPSIEAVQEIWARGGEGAIIKKLDGSYQPGVRTPNWVKVKKEESTIITITGWDKGKSGDYSVAVGKDENGTEIRVKTLDANELRAAEDEWDRTLKTPFKGRRLVVSFQERTPDGKARHPMWDHWAADTEK